MREELELLYSVYYQNYVQIQKELHYTRQQQEVIQREELYDRITTLQEELLWDALLENTDLPQSADLEQEAQDIAEIIRKKRQEMSEKRAQRDK